MAPQKTVAINCYSCIPGTDGCGPSFKKQGAGVIISTIKSSAVYCAVCIYLYSRNILTSLLCRKTCILPIQMLLTVVLNLQEIVRMMLQHFITKNSMYIVVKRICATKLRWEKQTIFLQ